ncbi:MAG: hypothetical protein E7260_09570 [Lachnospiraceae bacterium]|nr:hypothetical protein [Lachnospiraceae bacterium]
MKSSPVILDNMVYYNGAEQYKNEKWVFFSNYPHSHSVETDITIIHSGLICRVNPTTTDRFGKTLPDNFAVELPADLGLYEQSDAVNKKFDLCTELREEYEKRFYEQGIVPEGYFSWERPCYLGCEKEYGLKKPEKTNKA